MFIVKSEIFPVDRKIRALYRRARIHLHRHLRRLIENTRRRQRNNQLVVVLRCLVGRFTHGYQRPEIFVRDHHAANLRNPRFLGPDNRLNHQIERTVRVYNMIVDNFHRNINRTSIFRNIYSLFQQNKIRILSCCQLFFPPDFHGNFHIVFSKPGNDHRDLHGIGIFLKHHFLSFKLHGILIIKIIFHRRIFTSIKRSSQASRHE